MVAISARILRTFCNSPMNFYPPPPLKQYWCLGELYALLREFQVHASFKDAFMLQRRQNVEESGVFLSVFRKYPMDFWRVLYVLSNVRPEGIMTKLMYRKLIE